MNESYFKRYENLDTHWYRCRVCGGRSLDSDTAELAGLDELSEKNCQHDRFCPGRAFPDKHVFRVTQVS